MVPPTDVIERKISYSTTNPIDSSIDAASVTLRRSLWLLTAENPGVETARMLIEVIAVTGITTKHLFVWERIPVFVQGETSTRDRVVCVAKVSDLSVYPEDDVDLVMANAGNFPFYRLEKLDAPFENVDDLNITWRDTVLSFKQLLKALVDLGRIKTSS